MKNLLLLIPLLAILSGCARLNANLHDISTEKSVDGTLTKREITTHITGTALFSSAQTLEKFKALQTDKTQSIGGSNLSQHGATNVVEALDKIERIISHMSPKP
jgi:hypothetical protein